METAIYREQQSELWDSFITTSNNGTLFSKQNFFSYHPPDRFTHHHLIFSVNDSIAGVFPCAEAERFEKKFLVSHPGSSYGGIITTTNSTLEEHYLFFNALVDYARTNDFQGIELTRAPQLYYCIPNDYTDFLFSRVGAFYRKRELTAITNLPKSKRDIAKLLHPSARTSMRKSLRGGIEIAITDDFAAFYEILKTNLLMRHNVSPTHSLQELLLLKERFPTDVLLFGAYYHGVLIAGCVVFVCNSRILLGFYISQDYDHQNLRPLNALFPFIYEWAIDHHYFAFDYGTFTLNGTPNLGLGRFKETLGARGVFRDTLCLDFEHANFAALEEKLTAL